MSRRAPLRWVDAFAVLTVLAVMSGVTLAVVNRATMDLATWGLYAILDTAALVYASVGVLISHRHPTNVIGRLFLVMAAAFALIPLGQEYAVRGLGIAPGSLPAANVIGYSTDWLWIVAIVPLGPVLLLFPDGRPLHRRWAIVVWTAVSAAAVNVAADLLAPQVTNGNADRFRDHGFTIRNPIYLPSAKASADAALAVSSVALIGTMILAAVSIVVRLRRAHGVEREQVRWLAYAGAGALALVPLLPIAYVLNNNAIAATFWFGLTIVLVLGIPLASAAAILKYRLYDIDVVINKTLVYGSLAAFITAVYVGIVVGIGAAIGQGTSKPNLGLSILATAVVAVAFQPVRERIQKLANRLVYGKRATPYEVLSEFGRRMAGTYAADDVLPRMARILAEGTGAKEARVWLKVSGELIPTASWPDANGDGHAPQADADLVVPVSHQGEELGALSIVKSAGDRITPAEEKLTTDLASQAGLVLRNVKLIEDLKASRVRLVQAQDEERRKIERNIHDGAQQQLVALNVKLGLTKAIAPKNPAKAEELLTQLQEETNQALSDLRDLARGIYPPLLADKGLVVALEAQARRAAIPVTVEADAIGRYPQDAEAAVYFCVLEALQNVAKYAGASHATITVSATDGQLNFTVTDDGAGFDTSTTSYGTGLQGMADRLSALGGEIEVISQTGQGTMVSGRLPTPRLEPVG